jgi:hypothetical protein
MVLLKELRKTKSGLLTAIREDGKKVCLSPIPVPGIAYLDDRPGNSTSEKMENLREEVRQSQAYYLISGTQIQIQGSSGSYALYNIFYRRRK